jgi:D-lactate dehydrogenase (cytochrome)
MSSAAVVDALTDQFGERVSTKTAIREHHAGGESYRDGTLPDAVVFARSNDEVARVLSLANEWQVPVIPFGTGTSLEGQLQAAPGTISLDVSQMDAVLEVNAADLDCRVQAGVTREALNAHVKSDGLFFPLDPGANASLGGMAATRASGTNAVRYGTMRDVTMGLTVVTPQGKVVRTGGRARKSSAGYDLTRLYIGSEGTLGVITELQLRLFGIPERIAAAVVPFGTLEGAVEAVTLILQIGVPVARIELLDALQMRACILHSKLTGFAEAPTLFLEFHGSPAAVADQIAQVREVTESFGGGDFRWAEAQEERTALWTARHNAYWAARALIPGHESFATDACVPISALPACIAEASAAADAAGIVAPITGHVGDGNFHMLVLYDPQDAAHKARAQTMSDTVARIALSHGGTVTGEHGIGLHKLPLMVEEHDAGALDVMRAVKAALDPRGIMNPGKTVPAA